MSKKKKKEMGISISFSIMAFRERMKRHPLLKKVKTTFKTIAPPSPSFSTKVIYQLEIERSAVSSFWRFRFPAQSKKGSCAKEHLQSRDTRVTQRQERPRICARLWGPAVSSAVTKKRGERKRESKGHAVYLLGHFLPTCETAPSLCFPQCTPCRALP